MLKIFITNKSILSFLNSYLAASSDIGPLSRWAAEGAVKLYF